jgi:hypothetical protein
MESKSHEARVRSNRHLLTWKQRFTARPHRPLNLQQSNVADDTLVNVQKNLYALQSFLAQNPQLFHSSPGEVSGARAAPVNEQEAWKVRSGYMKPQYWRTEYPQAEQNSVSQLQALLTRTIEAISFLLLLNDYRLGELIAKRVMLNLPPINPLTLLNSDVTQASKASWAHFSSRNSSHLRMAWQCHELWLTLSLINKLVNKSVWAISQVLVFYKLICLYIP